MAMTRWLVVAASIAWLTPLVLAQERPAPAAAPAPKGNAEQGRKLFVSYGCYQCHGYEAQGSSATGPRLGPRPLPFASFTRYVRNPTNQMPPYTAKVVSDAELADIYAFVESRPAPKPVTLLN
jgi:ubiquinol-cytochrome c reductase cytochrome c subunit